MIKTSREKKKLLFRIWTFPGYCETFLISQIVIAIKCGYEVKILTENLDNLKKGLHKETIEEYKIREKIIEENYNIPASRFKRFIKIVELFLINLLTYPKFYKFLKYVEGPLIKKIFQFQFLKKFDDFDIIHVQYGTNVKPFDVLKEIGVIQSKLVISFHGHDLYFPINGRIPNNGYYERTFKYADLLVANTNYLKHLLIKLGAPEKKIRTIPVSVDTEFFFPENKESKNETFSLITVGRLEIFKGQDFGIECISRLIEEGYDINYLLIGDGTQKEVLKKLITEKGLENNITLAGRKNQEEIRQYLQEQDVFLMTSVTDPDYGVESQGLVTAEAQACGLPVVAFDSGGVKYTIADGETGFIVPEKDVEAMAFKLKKMLNDKLLRNNMSQNAIEFIAKNYSKHSIQAKWKEVYNSLY